MIGDDGVRETALALCASTKLLPTIVQLEEESKVVDEEMVADVTFLKKELEGAGRELRCAARGLGYMYLRGRAPLISRVARVLAQSDGGLLAGVGQRAP